MSSSSSRTVLVTGGAGYIASHIVKQLLEEGNILVRATVRDRSAASKVGHLTSLPGASERLTLVEADLVKQGSFDEAAEGVEVIFHTASPFIREVKNPQKDLIEPAVHGTENILNAAIKSSTVKRVIVTSSVAGVYGNNDDKGPNGVFTEADWNRTSTIKQGPYSLSKRLAEEKAWEITKSQSKFDLVVINPGLVMGPALSTRSDSESVSIMCSMLNGKFKSGLPELEFGLVDVRDVALAHINAMKNKDASGRYICIASMVSMLAIPGILKKDFGKYPLPSMKIPKTLVYIVGPILGGFTWEYIRRNIGVKFVLDNSKIKKDGLVGEFRDLAATIVEMAHYVIETGLVKKVK